MDDEHPNNPGDKSSRVVMRGALASGLPVSAMAPASGIQLDSKQKASVISPGLRNPATEYPQPPIPALHQPWPRLTSRMSPTPDHGETAIKGAVTKKFIHEGFFSGLSRQLLDISY